MSKSHKKESSEIFTIQFDQVNDSSEIPGIAELLGSKTSTKISIQSSTHKSANSASLKSLKEFGTTLEIHFQLKENGFYYLQHNDLSARKFFGLDELFQGMKISTSFTQEFGAFSEFKQTEKAYLFDAFGITEQTHLQFVLNQANKILTVYVSEKSMLAKKDAILAYAENQNANLGGGSIELDLAA